MVYSTLAPSQNLGPIARQFFEGKNPWTDGFPSCPGLQKELDLVLGFIVSQGRREQYLPRLVRGKPPQRYECLNELRVAYYLNSMGFRIEDWDSIGSNDTRGEFTISVDGENAIFVEVKSPGWEGTLNRNEINRGRAREPKYLESEGIHRIKPNWEDVRKSVERGISQVLS